MWSASTESTRVPVLALRGAPGVGKSTVGRVLVDRLGAGAVVEVDRFRAMLGGCDWHDRSQHRIAMTAACNAAAVFAVSGVAPVFVIDTFGRDGLALAREVLAQSHLRLRSLSLWAEPDVLRRRLDARDSGCTDWEMSRRINDEVRERRPPDDELLDTTRLDVEAVAVQIGEVCVACGCTQARPQDVGNRAAPPRHGTA